MANVKKLETIDYLRSIGDRFLLKLPLPKVNPDHVSGLSVLVSVFVLFTSNITYHIIIISLVWLLDWLDGVIAKKYKMRKTKLEKQQGWIVDVYADRLSEGIIFLVYFLPYFPLFILNCILTLVSYKRRIHTILPLRHILLFHLIIKVIFKI